MATDDTHKTCVRCAHLGRHDATKPLSAFPANPKTRDGKSSWCQQCTTENRRLWLAAKAPAERARWQQEQRDNRRARARLRRLAARAAAALPEPLAA